MAARSASSDSCPGICSGRMARVPTGDVAAAYWQLWQAASRTATMSAPSKHRPSTGRQAPNHRSCTQAPPLLRVEAACARQQLSVGRQAERRAAGVQLLCATPGGNLRAHPARAPRLRLRPSGSLSACRAFLQVSTGSGRQECSCSPTCRGSTLARRKHASVRLTAGLIAGCSNGQHLPAVTSQRCFDAHPAACCHPQGLPQPLSQRAPVLSCQRLASSCLTKVSGSVVQAAGFAERDGACMLVRLPGAALSAPERDKHPCSRQRMACPPTEQLRWCCSHVATAAGHPGDQRLGAVAVVLHGGSERHDWCARPSVSWSQESLSDRHCRTGCGASTSCPAWEPRGSRSSAVPQMSHSKAAHTAPSPAACWIPAMAQQGRV